MGKYRKLAAATLQFKTVAFHVQAALVITRTVNELAASFAKQLGLATSLVPVPLDAFTISMVWHASYDQDSAHRWLREVLVLLGREATKDQSKAAL